MLARHKAKRIALSRIKHLFSEAASRFSQEKTLSHTYVKKARRIGMKYRVSLPSSLKRRYCKHCYAYLHQGANVRVRTNKKGVVYTCKECGKQTRIPL